MMNPKTGVTIKDRRYHFRVYHSCFVGSEAVDWMVKEFNLKNRNDAVLLGQLLGKRGAFHHVVNEHPFKDDFLFYRFYKVTTVSI
jgi:potassium efflux system protein